MAVRRAFQQSRDVGNGQLPLAVQLVAAPWSEARLLAAAAWCERVIGFTAGPPL